MKTLTVESMIRLTTFVVSLSWEKVLTGQTLINVFGHTIFTLYRQLFFYCLN